MHGQHLYYRITLLQGLREKGIFRVERHSAPIGEPRPRTIPYQVLEEMATAERMVELVDGVLGEKSAVGSSAVIVLKPKSPVFEYDYDDITP